MVNRILFMLLVVAVIGVIAIPYVVHRDIGPSPLLELHQQEAHAQVETGLLAAWLAANGIGSLFDALGAIGVIEQTVRLILPFLNGRPEGQATWCITVLLAVSQNRLVQELAASFCRLLQYGHSLSKQWWYYTDVANRLCLDMEAKCGFALGSEACQKYLGNSIEWNTPCASASYWAFAIQQTYDTKYARCQ